MGKPDEIAGLCIFLASESGAYITGALLRHRWRYDEERRKPVDRRRLRGPGTNDKISTYDVADNELAAGSTFGSPKATVVIKASGAIEKFIPATSVEMFGAVRCCTTGTTDGYGALRDARHVPDSSRTSRARLSAFERVRVPKNLFVLERATRRRLGRSSSVLLYASSFTTIPKSPSR